MWHYSSYIAVASHSRLAAPDLIFDETMKRVDTFIDMSIMDVLGHRVDDDIDINDGERWTFTRTYQRRLGKRSYKPRHRRHLHGVLRKSLEG